MVYDIDKVYIDGPYYPKLQNTPLGNPNLREFLKNSICRTCVFYIIIPEITF